MEISIKSNKNVCRNWITTWIFIYLSFFHTILLVRSEETTEYSSGMGEDTTIYREPTTGATITPFLTTFSARTESMIPTFENTHQLTSLVTLMPTTRTVPEPQCHKQTNFLAWGPSTNDDVFPAGDDNFLQECPSIEIPINSIDIGCFHISTNGYITNGQVLPFTPDEKALNKKKITLIPFWSDIDTRYRGKVYYQIADLYLKDSNKDIASATLSQIKTLFSEYGQDFDPVYAVKITWDKVVHYDKDTINTKELTFQFILASDGAITNMAYIYDDCQTSWLTTRTAIMGYSYPGFQFFYRNSLTPEIFDVGLETNTQKKTKGVWIFELSKQYKRNHAKKCLDWYNNENPVLQPWASLTAACPCTLWQARRDFRYTRGPNNCFYLTFLFFGYSKVCCYLPGGRWSARGLSRGNLQVYSGIIQRRAWREFDYTPYSDCCLNSNYCTYYNEYRPSDFCIGYRPIIFRFTFGDPHIQTLDGFSYTFNGLGEFELLNVYNKTDTTKPLLNIQCRTKEVGTNNRQATVFNAFAIRSQGVTIHVATRDTMEALKIFGDDIELTSFYTDKTYVWSKGPFYLTADQSKNNTIVIRHISQSVLDISLQKTVLHMSIKLGYDHNDVTTNGLLGTYNKNPADDLQTPSGKILSENSTEEQIYYNFGMLWKVNDSILHYESGETKDSFVKAGFTPTFLKMDTNSAEYKKAVEICTADRRDCIYDYLVTQDKDLATNTNKTEQEIKFNRLLTKLVSPTLNGSKTAVVNVNQKEVHTISVINTNGTLELEVVHQENCNISLVNSEVKVSIDLPKSALVKSVFQVKNSYNMSTAVFNLTVMICPDCNGHGVCNETRVNLERSYEYVCDCNKGWRGDHCNIDARCDPLGCPCTGPDHNYTCECPAGYTYVDKCVDINECSSQSTNNCSQICTNTIGSYTCSCKTGYRLVNRTECINLNECDLSINNCEQICTDTEGSFTCSCYPGFNLINNNKCDKGADVCNNTIDCSNATGCTIINGNPSCFCKNGYAFNNDTKTCEDIDECATITCIGGTCENTEGSYVCKCPIGSKLGTDGRTCEECGNNKWGENCAETCSGANCIFCNKTTGCQCREGFEGTTCDQDINECSVASYCNSTASTCQNSIGSATCICKVGFKPDKEGKCVDIDECVDNNGCSVNAECTNTFGSHFCTCLKGYQGDGKNCTDIDECRTENPCSDMCMNQEGSFSCICRNGAKLLDDRRTCKLVDGLSYQERLYIILFSSLAGAVLAAILISCWCYYFGCCCCKKRRPTYPSTLNDRYFLRDAFGSLSSSLSGKLVRDETFAGDTVRASKYLEDWSHFSPYSQNNQAHTENPDWEDFNESTSSWGNIANKFDNQTPFRIERPYFRP